MRHELEDLTDDELIRRFQRGDQDAFQALFSRYGEQLRRFAARRLPLNLRRRVSVADVLQH